MSLVQGLLQNPRLEDHPGELNKLIRVYDHFEMNAEYILEHIERNYPEHDCSENPSYLGVFNKNMQAYTDMLDVRPGDVIKARYSDDSDIEILGITMCKALPITDFVVREFFPRLLEGALVIQKDFIHQYHPHIHLSMMLLDDYFDLDVEIKWGGSLAYRLKKTISPEVILERFGNDSSWYNQVHRNVVLLRDLEARMHYDENKWIIMQVLGMYHWAMGEQEKAEAMYHETRERFPHFDLPDDVTRLMGKVGV